MATAQEGGVREVRFPPKLPASAFSQPAFVSSHNESFPHVLSSGTLSRLIRMPLKSQWIFDPYFAAYLVREEEEAADEDSDWHHHVCEADHLERDVEYVDGLAEGEHDDGGGVEGPVQSGDDHLWGRKRRVCRTTGPQEKRETTRLTSNLEPNFNSEIDLIFPTLDSNLYLESVCG